MKWEKVKLGDVCIKIGSGATPKGGSTVYIEKGTAFIRSQNVYNLYFDFSGLVFINEEAAKKLNGVTIEKNDILLNITGDSVARTCLAPEELLPARVNQHVAIVRPDKNILNPIFLNYYLASPNMQSRMLGLAVGKGASRNAMTKEMIASFKVPCPSLDIQNKIVNILKPYDDLIENNQNQIKLLEEAAQRLYKEWFVDFHFPGYEDTKFIDGIPNGWRKHKIDDVFKIKYGKTLSTSKINKTGKYPVYGANGVIGFYNEKNCSDCVVLITSRGNGSGDISRTYDKESFVTNNSFIVNPFNKSYRLSYVHQLIKTINFKNICTGSAQPQLTNNSISMLSVMVASDELVGRFCDVGNFLYEKIDNILKQNILLTQARDRLLPKLMSGEIEV